MPGSAIASPALGVGNRLTMDASARRRDVSANGVPSTNKVTTGSDRPSRSVPTSPRMTAADKAKSVGAVNMGSQTPHAGQTGRLHTGKVSSVTASANSATVAVAASLQKGGSMNGGGAKSISYAAMVLRSSQSVGTTGTNVGGTGTGGHGSGNTINGGGSGQQAPDNKTEKNSHKGKGDGGAGDATSSSSAAGGLKGKRQARSPVGVWAAKPASVVKAAPDMSTGMNNGTANGAAGGIVSGMMGNGLMGNGAMGNGTMGNGAITNGAMANGTMANGAMSNGAMSNGTMASGNGKAGRGGGWSVVNGGGAGGGRKGLAGGKGGLRSQVEVDGASGQQAGVDMNGIMRAVKSHAIGKADDGESA